VLAILFALVIGISMWALLIGDYMNSVMNAQAQQSLRIVGFAGALSALATWWVQGFAAKRGFVVRVMFALFIFVVAFCSFGGLLRVIYSHISYPNQQDWSLSGLYWASQSDLVSFVLFMLVPPRPAYAALILAASIYVALFGPREPKAVEI
jgi:fluoride ion exporter CrcB/FEX